jgi:NTE family protein
MQQSKKAALVLATGGARGLAHIGVIEELLRQNYCISSVAGCSIGAVIGAAYASGYWDECKKALCSINNRTIFRFIDPGLSRKGIIRGEKMYRMMERIFSDTKIEDLKIPYAAVATNILNQQEVVFSRGKIIDALRASISLPFVFKPYEFNNMSLVDGGLLNPLPLNRVSRTDGDILIGVSVGAKKSELKAYNKFSLLMESAAMIVQTNIRKSCIENKPGLLIEVPVGDYSIFNFKKYDELVEEGVKATQKALQTARTSPFFQD